MAYSLTVRDAIDHLRDWSGGNAGTSSESNIRKAILLAYRDVSQHRKWQYYLTQHRIQLQASYDTGTVAYDHTGGSSERLVTLSGGTLPTDVSTDPTGWDIAIGDVVSRVESYLSSTTLTLDATLNPGADVASGTSYTLYKARYLLPANYRSLDESIAENLWYAQYVQPRDWLFSQRNAVNVGTPCRWTVTGDERNSYRFSFLVDPAPSEAETLDFWYQREPRELCYTGYNEREYAGTITGSTATFTGSSTQFESGMVGALLRIGTTSSQVPDGRMGLNPYSDELTIRSYSSTTSIRTTASPSASIFGKKYVISDPIDIAPSMEVAFTRACEYHLCVLKKGSAADQQRTYQAFIEALSAGAAADSRVYTTRFSGDRPTLGRRLGNMPYNSTVVE